MARDTLVDLLEYRANSQADTILYSFLEDGEHERVDLSCAELWRRATAVAAQLRDRRGERIVLLYPPGLDYIIAFYGCVIAGAIAVPVYPPDPSRLARSAPRVRHVAALARLQAIVRAAGATVALTTAAIKRLANQLVAIAPDLTEMPWLATDDLGSEQEHPSEFWRATANDIAFLQYTSGSTRAPRGVALTHRNILHNQALIQQAFGTGPSARGVGWLPLYHDMGLIGNIIHPLYAGFPVVLMSPVHFMAKPVRWLRAITTYRATVSGGPSFAYQFCAERITDTEIDTLDLSGWNVAFNGAEPVRAQAIDRFVRRFARCGFRETAMSPCYGLAEASLIVTGGTCGRASIRSYDDASLDQGRGEPPGFGAARTLVASGRALRDQEVLIVDPVERVRCPPGRIGEIWTRSDSVASMYWGDPELSEQVFGARLATGDGPYLRTGDLGFLDDGLLFVNGRIKDLIIVRGRNCFPQDIELTIEGAHAAIRAGSTAAFSIDVEAETALVVAAEVKQTEGIDAGEITDAIRHAIARDHELHAREVLLLRIGALPKTSSGKIQRHAARQGYLAGTLELIASPGAAGACNDAERQGVAPARDERSPDAEQLRRADPEQRRAAVLSYLHRKLGELLHGGALPTQIDRFAATPVSHLGLDSMMSVQMVHAIEQELGVVLPVTALMRDDTADEVATRIAEAVTTGSTEVRSQLDDGVLSAGQAGLWLLQVLSPTSSAYNIACAVSIRGPLAIDALHAALQAQLDRHAILRTNYLTTVDGPRQIVSARDLDFEVIDAGPASADELGELVAIEANRPFFLDGDCLIRVRVYRRQPDEHVLLLTIHHIIADLRSLTVLVSELRVLYPTMRDKRDVLPPPAAEDYCDFVRRERDYLTSPRATVDEQYWLGALAGVPAVLALPFDRAQPRRPDDSSGSITIDLPAAVVKRARAFARAHNATLFVVLLSAYQVSLSRLCAQRDLVIGIPSSGRTRAEISRTLGYFVNTLAVRADLGGRPSFRDVVWQTRDRVLEALDHQEYPFMRLVERLAIMRDGDRSPLVQTMFALEHPALEQDQDIAMLAVAGIGNARLDDLVLEPFTVARSSAQFDLSLNLAQVGDRVAGTLAYRAELFEQSTATRLRDQYLLLLEQGLATPSLPIDTLDILGDLERDMLLVGRNDTRRDFGAWWSVHELFEARASETPDAVALICDDERWSYRELDQRSSRLALALAARGAGPERLFGVYLDRGPDVVLAILGILKSGAAYVPLDPCYPRERIARMIASVELDAVVTSSGRSAELPDPIDRVLLDSAALAIGDNDPPARPLGSVSRVVPSSLAYVIFTSGSTGAPKPTAVSHAAIANSMRWINERFAFGSSDCIMQTASTSFDASVWEILAPLMTGARMSIVRDSADLDAVVHVLKTSEVTALLWVPSLLRAMVDHPEFTEASRTLRLLFCGGEPFESSLRDSVVRITDAVPVNLYGPTECAIYATSSECRSGPVTLGRPVANTRVYVVDEYLQLVSSGVVGELCIGGAQVARGYLGMPALTAEKFVPDPFGDEPGARLYRTGDRVRWSPEGELEFLGRPDAQVKVRGFRVELGEVESALLADPVVREAVVVARSDAHGSNSLAAYVTMRDLASDTASSETMASSAALRTRLSAKLPNYMVPGDIQILDKLPLSPSGKLDRHALPAAHVSSHLRRYEAPRDALEAQLCAIFAEVLQVPRVGIRDNFFALGGHSLLAARAVSRILNVLKRAVPLRTLFEAGTVAELAMRAVSTAELDPIGHADREAPLVLSFSQERLWLLDQMMPGSGSYNVAVALRLRGALDEPALARAFDELVRRHEALRTTFVWEQGAARQHIQPASEGTLQIDASAISDAELVRRVQAEASRPFELSRGPLLRATLLRCSDSERVLCVTAHHIVCDGWSAGVVVREVLELYQAFSCGLRSPLAELDLQYADFAAWQRTAMSSERLASGLSHWRQALEGAPPALHLPCDRTRPSRQSYRGAALSFTVPADVTTELRALGRAQNATLFMTLLASFGAFLWRHTAQADFLIGTPVANRARTELEGLIGFFVNTLPLRVRISEGQTFEQLLEAVKATSLSAFEYQEIPFEKIVEAVNPPRDMSRSPLFQVMFALQNAPSTEFEIEGLDVETVPIEVDSAKFDLLLDVNERESTLEMVFQYNIDLFERKTIERMRDRLLGLFAAIVRSPRARMDELTLLSVEEQRSLLVDHNATHRDFGGTRLVHELFEAQVARTPTAVAVDCEHERWSYRDLNERADQLAHELLSSNPRPERFIGVYLDRGPEIVQAMLGILKSGAVYVPLDPGYPPDRVAQMIASIGLDCVVTSRRRSAELPEHITRVTIDSPLLAQQSGRPARPPYGSCTAGSLAYVIFTSGSTGAPKATGISHAAIANHMLWMNERFGFGPQDCIVQRTSTSFDASVWELLAPLTTGARMTMVRATADVRLLVQAMLSAKATVLQCVPSLLRVLVADPGFADAARALRLVFCGGEPFESSLRDALVRVTNATPVNLYGPTECTIDATFLECKLGPVTLGRPVANVRAYVLDERLQLVPSGIPGELCIGGAQLARGYLGMPALTAERFVPDPFGEPGARLYRTGDRVRWAPTGDLEFLGRFDDQVKIRGFRIEFGEIEAKLAEHPGVAMVAAAVNPGADRLIAYVVPKDPSARLQPGQLRDFLARLVPAHMVPSVFVLLDSLPRMASGKIDRRALPQPQAVGETIRVDDELEAAILGLWTNLVPGLLLQRDVTFFDAGGSSLDIVRLQAALAQELSISVPVTAFFEHPTLEALARYVRTSGSVPPTYSRQTRDDRIEKLHALGSRRRNSP